MTTTYYCACRLNEAGGQLVRDLLEAHIVGLEDARRTVEEMPELAAVAAAGAAEIDAQIATARSALEAVKPL